LRQHMATRIAERRLGETAQWVAPSISCQLPGN
jgi:hypothetical protein